MIQPPTDKMGCGSFIRMNGFRRRNEWPKGKGAKNCPADETVRFEREQRGFSLHALNGVSRAAAAGEADAMRRRRRRARTAHKRWVYAKAFAGSLS